MAGRVFYDADCAFCQRQVERLERCLGPGRVQYSPLQSPGAAEHLNLPPAELLSQMHFIRSDGRRFSGADAVLELGRLIWWARPLARLGSLPGIVQLLRLVYRAVAIRRHRAGGNCSRSVRHRRRRAFFELP